MKKVYCYGRGSTCKQVTTLKSQKGQTKGVARLIFKARGFAYGGFFGDRGVTGGIAIGDRPKGRKMCLRLNNGDAVVIAKIDRAFRDAADAAVTIKAWWRRGITLYAMDCGLDTSTPIGRGIASFMAVIAEMERYRISERLRERSIQLKKEGRVLSGMKQWGMKTEIRVEGFTERKYLVPDLEEREIMGIMLRLREEEEWILRDIANYLNKEGLIAKDRKNSTYKNKKKGLPWKWSYQKVQNALAAEKALRVMEGRLCEESVKSAG